ncbi:alpha/beta hydrolase [Effusibacillus dendaii]|uniref:Lysophospholipase n=1 Tax=Effusibacillus dendaii TaxID=2743772 RepID=A0A7I8D4S1_9BACL|nr:alpha/beta hydrolase [Effusibacillus dendaii]BCJ85084.1 lysophospholipase [Effusibacillus dendaii]
MQEELFFQKWLPQGPMEGAVLIVHGAGEHSGRYQHVIEFLRNRQFAVFAGDLPGLGRSGGRRGHIDQFQQYVDCLKNWLLEVSREVGDRPIFLLGHSMGGLVTIRLLQHPNAEQLPIRGAVVTSPCLRLRMRVPKWQQKLAKLLLRIAPKLRIPNRIRANDVCRSEAVASQYRQDPNMEFRVSVRWYHELQKAMKDALLQAGSVKHPLLILQAGADRLVDPEAAIVFAERLTVVDRSLKLYPGLYHELLNEPEQEVVLGDLTNWIKSRK